MDSQSYFLLRSSGRYNSHRIRIGGTLSTGVFKNRLVRMQDCCLEFWTNSSRCGERTSLKGGEFVAVGRRSWCWHDSGLFY